MKDAWIMRGEPHWDAANPWDSVRFCEEVQRGVRYPRPPLPAPWAPSVPDDAEHRGALGA